MTTKPSPHAKGRAACASGSLPQPNQTQDDVLQLPLFVIESSATSDKSANPRDEVRASECSEPTNGPPQNPVEAHQIESKGMEWLNEDPFPPPPPFLLPGEHLRKSIEKCIGYIIQHEGLGRSTEFEQFVFLLCAKLLEERNPDMPRRFLAGEKEDRTEEGCAAIRGRIAALFDEVKEAAPSLFGTGDHLALSDTTIAFVVTTLGKHNLSSTELDPLGVAYQQWRSATARYDRGQFFTPLGSALFATCLLDPLEHERALDYACGCGAFLSALYMYRASQLGVEFAEGIPAIPRFTEEVPVNQATGRLARYMCTQVYGAELDAFLAEIARKQLALAQGEPSHVYRMDSLAFPDGGSDAVRAAADIPLGSLDCLAGNPPFGLRITDNAVLKRYELARVWTKRGESDYQREERISKQAYSETLFLERAIDWLKPGGRLALVVPDGVLSDPSTQYARDWLLKHATLLAVVSLPDEVFYVESRTHTKTSVLLMRKKTEAEVQRDADGSWDYSVFMGVSEAAGYNSRGRTLYKRGPDGEELLYKGRKLIDNDLPIVLSRYRQFCRSAHVSPPPA